MWITDIINKSNKTYATNKEALEDAIKIITAWATNNKVNAYLYHSTVGKRANYNRVLNIITQSGRGYYYKLTIHRFSDGAKPSLKRLNNSGYSYNNLEYLNIAFKFYDDDPA